MLAAGRRRSWLHRVCAAAWLASFVEAAGASDAEGAEDPALQAFELERVKAGAISQIQALPALPTSVEDVEQLPRPWLILLAGGTALLTCQVCAIGYIQCFHRARYEGRAFWYRGPSAHVVDQLGCCSYEPPNLSPTQIGELQHDLRNGRAYWTGNWGRDYRFHVANFHPLLSIFFCHPVHPFGKVPRVIVLAITVAFMVGWRRFVQEQVLDLPGSWDEDISWKVKDASKVVPALQRFSFEGQMVLFVYVTLPSMLAELFLTKLAVLHDSLRDFDREYGGRACCTIFVGWFISLVGMIACLLFYVLAIASLAFLVYTVYSVRSELKLGHGAQEWFYFVALMPWTLAQIWFVWWFIFDLFTPWVGFGLCHFCQPLTCLYIFRWQWWVEEEAMVEEPMWRVADTAHAYFGMEVHDDAFVGGDSGAILREEAGLVHDSTQKRWVAVERVAQKDLEAWVSSKMTGAQRGQALLSQVEAQRALSIRSQQNECVELVPCCLGTSRRGGRSLLGMAAE